MKGYLFFHSPCFDGSASAAIAWDVLEARHGWGEDVEITLVDYGLAADWLNRPLRAESAVVDFLFHPRATYFADHHATSFLESSWRANFVESRNHLRIFDPSADSCAGLLWKTYRELLLERGIDRSELAEWADKIDGAKYPDVNEAIFARNPATRVRAVLGGPRGLQFSAQLARALRKHSLEEISELPEVREALRETEELTKAGLGRIEESLEVDAEGVATYDVDGWGAMINRYAPYLFHPTARYSAGIVRYPHQAKILVMRNPWMEFRSAPIGDICEHFGGGGHERVGAIDLRGRRTSEASHILSAIVSMLEGGGGAKKAIAND
jgi:hypothetical protein